MTLASPDPADHRLTRVEEKIAHLERFVGELDVVVREAFDRIDALRGELDKLRAAVEADGQAQADAADVDPEADRPPHW